MRLTEFLRRLPTLMMNDFDDARFVALRQATRGMTSPRIGKLLWYATRELNPLTEVYCEHGTWTGFSIAAAGLDMADPLLIGIDPYDLEFASSEVAKRGEKEMENNLNFFRINAVVYKDDFRNIKWNRQETIGVFFIDADHTYQDVIDSWKWGLPLLSDEALIVLDDIRTDGIEEAMSELLQTPGMRLEAFVRGELQSDLYSHNGFAILSYKKEKNAKK